MRRFLFPLLLMLSPSLDGAIVKRIVIEPTSELDFIIEALPVRAGQAWERKFLSLSDKYLETTGRYSEVKVEFDEASETLSVSAEPLRYFQDVRYTKEKPKDDSEIRSICVRTKEDLRLTQERISQISNCVISRIQDEGFLDVQAFVFADGDFLAIEINKGSLYRVEKIEFLGLQDKNAWALKRGLSNQENSPYRPLSLSADSKAIFDSYFSTGYLQVRLSSPSVHIDPVRRRVKITWKVREGKQFFIEFLGDYTSKKPIERIRESGESAPEWFLDDLQEMIRQDLTNKGFLDNYTHREVKELKGARMSVKFFTTRGRQYLLTEPLWVGLRNKTSIQAIYNKILRLSPGRAFGELEFRKAFEESFFPLLIQNGFQDVKVRSLEFSIDRKNFQVQPVIYMNEGDQRVIQAANISGAPSEFSKVDEFEILNESLSLQKPYNAILVEENLRLFLQFLRNEGYLDVKGEAKWDPKTASLQVLIIPGPRYRIDDAIVRGLERTNLGVIRKQFQFKKGDFYSQEKVNDTTTEILRLGLARSIDIQVIDKDPQTGWAFLLIDISEAARFRFEIGPGYGTVDGLRGVFRGTYANIGGKGRRLSVYAKASRRIDKKHFPSDVIGIDPLGNVTDPEQVKRIPFLERRVTMEYFEPNFILREIDGRVVLKHELLSRRQFGVENYSISMLTDYRPFRFLTYTPSFKVEYSDPFNIKIANETRSVDDTSPSRLHSFGQRVLLSFVDDSFNPSKGLRFDTTGDIYSRLLGGNDNFWMLSAEQAVYWPVFEFDRKRKVGFAFSLSSGFSSEFNETVAIPVDKRFRLGGEASVRGFAEDAIQPLDRNGDPLRNGGKSIFYFRSELSLPIVGWVDLLGFFDGGNLYETNQDFAPWDLVSLRYGAGMGVRLNTPVGPVKVGYAFVLDRKPGEDMGQIYFGVGPL